MEKLGDLLLTLPHLAYLVLATFAGWFARSGYKWTQVWLYRKKPAAEATEITIRARVTEGDAVVRWMGRLEEAQANIDRLRTERNRWQDEYDTVFVERDELLRKYELLQKELEFTDAQMKRMKGAADAKGLKLSEFDEPK